MPLPPGSRHGLRRGARTGPGCRHRCRCCRCGRRPCRRRTSGASGSRPLRRGSLVLVGQLGRIGLELHLAGDVAGAALRADPIALRRVGALVARVDHAVAVGISRWRRGRRWRGSHDGGRDGSHRRDGLGRPAKQVLEAEVQRPEVAIVDVEPVGFGADGELFADTKRDPAPSRRPDGELLAATGRRRPLPGRRSSSPPCRRPRSLRWPAARRRSAEHAEAIDVGLGIAARVGRVQVFLEIAEVVVGALDAEAAG